MLRAEQLLVVARLLWESILLLIDLWKHFRKR